MRRVSPTPALQACPFLVEREAPLQALQQAWQDTHAHGGLFAFVSGDAGLGKTSLVQAFVAGLPDAKAVATGWCDPMHTPRPLGPVRDLARCLLGPVDVDGDDPRLFERLLQCLTRRPRGANRVHVLVVEDLHWLDQRSADWLSFVGRRLASLPVLIVATGREEDPLGTHPLDTVLAALPATRLRRMPLTPLTPHGTERLCRLASGVHGADAVQALHRITEGNPFFVYELLQQWPTQPGVDARDMALPRTVAHVLQGRMAGLPASLQDLLALVACSPAALPQALLRRVASAAETAQIDDALARRILSHKAHTLQFHHELMRMAVLERVPPAARRALHRRWLDVLLAQPGDAHALDLIVHHARGAGAADVLLTHAPRAAAHAAAFGAHREAAQHLEGAMGVAAGAPPEVAATILECWAYEASIAHGVGERTLAARQEAVRLWRSVRRLDKVGDNLAALARMHRYRGEPTQALALIEQAVALLATQAPSAMQARAVALQSQFRLLHGRMEDAMAGCARALQLADAVADVQARSHALNTLGSARMQCGDVGGEQPLRDSLAIALQHGLHEHAARAYTNLAEGLMALRQLSRAEAAISEGLAYDRAHDFGRWIDYVLGRQAQLRFEQERHADALSIADGVLAQPPGPPLMRLPALIARAGAALRLGLAEARPALDEAMAMAERAGEMPDLVAVRLLELEAAVLRGQPHAALAAARQLDALPAGAVGPRARGVRDLWSRLAGVVDPRPGAPGPEPLSGPFALAQQRRFDEAITAFEAEGSTYLAAWVHVAAARAPDGPAGPSRQRHLQLADATFRRLQAQAARDALPQVGGERGTTAMPGRDAARRGPYAAARGHAYGLTAREQQVLGLVADGCDNGAIAQRLQRSRRTVENHVSAILDKLQARNRLELVLRAQREPWIVGPPPAAPLNRR